MGKKEDWFVLATPMPAEGREECLLGIAVEKPYRVTQSEFTPQGLKSDKSFAPTREEQTKNPGLVSMVSKAFFSSATPEEWEDEAEPDKEGQAPSLYSSPCPWPKDLINNSKIYPNSPVEATGVAASIKEVSGTEMGLKALKSIAAVFKIDVEKLEDLWVPLLNRYDMESPEARIKDLLDQPAYQRRVISLLNRGERHDVAKPKVVYIVTNFIACSGMSINTVRTDHQSLSLQTSAAEPSAGTIPLEIKGKAYHIKRTSRAAEYSANKAVIVALSYRALSYLCLPKHELDIYKDGATKPWISFWKKDLKLPKKKPLAWFPRNDESGLCDCFWVAGDGGKDGNSKAWFGKSNNEKARSSGELTSGVFVEGMNLVSQDDNAEDEGDEDAFPPGWLPVVSESDEYVV
ncbi:hypothetical protein ACEPPN_004738 [Leptodophora sp. 'Broadleaf-Isolate-01']